MWKRDELISNQFAITKESDIESLPLEDVNKNNHWSNNCNSRSEKQICLDNTYEVKKIEEMSEYRLDLTPHDVRSRNNTLPKVGSAFKEASSQSFSQQLGVGLSPAFGDEANVFLPWDEIHILELFGSGTYGKIYKATYDYMKVAVKVLNVPWEKLPEKQRQEFLHEIRTAIQVSHHENVLRVYGCTLEPVVSIITELCDHGSVLDCVKAGYKLKIDKKLDICIDAARGVLSLHDKNVLHRDIASRNVLLDRHMTARIADFGMCRILKPVRTGQEVAYRTFSKVGPLKWMSPESLLMQKSSKKSDVWSFGVTIWEIFTEEEPYGTEPPYLAAAGVIHKGLRPDLSKLPGPIGEKLVPLLRACWRVCPEDRSSMQDVLTSLIRVQQEYISSLPRIPSFRVQQDRLSSLPSFPSFATPKSPSSSVRSVRDNIIYTIPVANSSSDQYELPILNIASSHHTGSLCRKIKPCPLQSNSPNVVHPIKNLQISPSQYSGHASIGPSYEYPQYSTPEHSNRRIQKIRVTPQARQNTEELGYRLAVPYPMTTPTSINPPSPKFDKQYSNMIPSKRIRTTQSFRKLTSITPCSTPRANPINSIPLIPAGMRVAYRNIDSISSTESITPEKKRESGTIASPGELKTELISFDMPKITAFSKQVNFLVSEVKFNDHHKHLYCYRDRATRKSTKTPLEQQITTVSEDSSISTAGSGIEIVLTSGNKYVDETMV